MISTKNLVAFISECAYKVVGESVEGTPTTLSDELAVIAKLTMRGDVASIPLNPYRRGCFSLVEYTVEELEERAEVSYKKAAKKLLWLNTISQRSGCGRFIDCRIDLNDQAQIEELVGEFASAIRLSASNRYQPEP